MAYSVRLMKVHLQQQHDGSNMQHTTAAAAATVAATSCTCMCRSAASHEGGSEKESGASEMAKQMPRHTYNML